jgi:hypothetical protein
MMARVFPMILSGQFSPRLTFDLEVNVRDEGDHYAVDNYFGVTIFRGKEIIDGWQFDDEPELQPAIRAAAERAVQATATVHAKQVEYSLMRKQNAA